MKSLSGFRGRLILAFSFVAALVFATHDRAFAVQEIKPRSNDKTIWKWTYDRVDDRLIGSGFQSESVADNKRGNCLVWTTRLDANGPTESSELEFDHEISRVIRKSEKYYATASSKNEVVVIEANPFRESGRIAIGSHSIVAIACSEAANDFIYALVMDKEARYYLQQIDTTRLAVVNEVMVADTSGGRSPETVAIHPNGKLLSFGPRRTYTLDEDAFIVTPFLDMRYGYGWFREGVDFHDRFLRFRQVESYDIGMKYEKRIFDNDPKKHGEPEFLVDIHPTRDLFVRLEPASDGKTILSACRFSDNTLLQQYKLPQEFRPQELQPREVGFQPREVDLVVRTENGEYAVLAWRSDDSVVYAVGDHIEVVDLASLTGAQPVRLSIEPVDDLSVVLGKTVEQKIELRFPVDDEVKYEIVSGPASAKVEVNQFSWTPGTQDVGLTRFELAANSGSQTSHVQFDVDVSRPFFTIDNEIDVLNISPDQRFLVGEKHRQKKVLVYDIESETLLKELGARPAISCTAIVDHYLFVFCRATGQARRYDLLDDFKLTLFDTSARVGLAQATPDGQLQIVYRSNMDDKTAPFDCMVRDVVDIETLQVDTSQRLVSFETALSGNLFDSHFGYLDPHHLLFGSFVFDLRTHRLCHNFGELWLPILSADEEVNQCGRRSVDYGGAPDGYYPWLRRGFEFFPGAIELTDKKSSTSGNQLTFTGFAEKQPSYSISICAPHQQPGNTLGPGFLQLENSRQPYGRPRAKGPGPNFLLQVDSGNTFLCRLSDRVYPVHVSPEELSGVETPIVFPFPDQGEEQIVFNTDQVFEIPLSVQGNSGDVTFEHIGLEKHVTVVGNKVVIDAPAILRDFISECDQFRIIETQEHFMENSISDKRLSLMYNNDRFKTVTGITPPTDCYQFQYPIQVMARDSSGKLSVFNRLIILLAPREAFKESLANQKQGSADR